MHNSYICKAKRKDTGEWVEGYFFHADKWSYIIPAHPFPFDEITGLRYVPVIPETVCRFTGKEDSKGNPVFEGDILDLTGYMIGDHAEVKYGEYSTPEYRTGIPEEIPSRHIGFYVHIRESFTYDYIRRELPFFLKHCKVIGNRFDNPELIQHQGKE